MLKPTIFMAVFLYRVVSRISILIVRDCEETIFLLLLQEKIWFTSLVVHNKDTQFLVSLSRTIYAATAAPVSVLCKTVFLKIS